MCVSLPRLAAAFGQSRRRRLTAPGPELRPGAGGGGGNGGPPAPGSLAALIKDGGRGLPGPLCRPAPLLRPENVPATPSRHGCRDVGEPAAKEGSGRCRGAAGGMKGSFESRALPWQMKARSQAGAARPCRSTRGGDTMVLLSTRKDRQARARG